MSLCPAGSKTLWIAGRSAVEAESVGTPRIDVRGLGVGVVPAPTPQLWEVPTDVGEYGPGRARCASGADGRGGVGSGQRRAAAGAVARRAVGGGAGVPGAARAAGAGGL